MNWEDFAYDYEDRKYLKPEVGLQEADAFIDNFRDVVVPTEMARIDEQTANLGKDVPSSQGGLRAPTNYFESRYVTPRVQNLIADLRAAAQTNALNIAMNNELNKAKKRYEDAYRAAEAKKNNNGNTTGGGNTSGSKTTINTNTNSNPSGTETSGHYNKPNLETNPVRIDQNGDQVYTFRYADGTTASYKTGRQLTAADTQKEGLDDSQRDANGNFEEGFTWFLSDGTRIVWTNQFTDAAHPQGKWYILEDYGE